MRGMELPESGHDPVMMAEVLEFLAPREGKIIVDCTLGRAGHASEIARRLGGTGRLIGLDADPRNLEFARERLVGREIKDLSIRWTHPNQRPVTIYLEISISEVATKSLEVY